MYYCRNRNGDYEVDIAVEGRDGGIVGIEVNLKPSIGDADVKLSSGYATRGPHGCRT